MSLRKDSGHAVLITGIVVLAVAILGVLGWLFWQNFINKPSTVGQVTTFEECKAAPGSIVQETFPEICRTVDGKSFTGPVANDEDGNNMLSYCAPAEKLCFEYPKTWTIKQLSPQNTEPGAKADYFELHAPNDALVFVLESAIGGLGGTCSDEYAVDISVLDATPAASMTGFKSDYSLDTLQVARVVYADADNQFIGHLYVTGSPQYTTPGMIRNCGLGFSQFVNGRNAVLSSDYTGAGAFTFGTNDGAPTYKTRAEAIAAFDTEIYVQGAAILASLHYE